MAMDPKCQDRHSCILQGRIWPTYPRFSMAWSVFFRSGTLLGIQYQLLDQQHVYR